MGKQLPINFDEEVEPVNIENKIEQVKFISAPLVLENLARQAVTSKNSQILSLFFKVIMGWTEKTGHVFETSDSSQFDMTKLTDEEKTTWLKLAQKAKNDD